MSRANVRQRSLCSAHSRLQISSRHSKLLPDVWRFPTQLSATSQNLILKPRARHILCGCTTMSLDYRNNKGAIASNIRNLLYSLNPSTYDEVAPKVEYWIEYIITEQFTTPEGLAEELSIVAWQRVDLNTGIPRFLKEFRDGPNRSEQVRSIVDELCLYLLRLFAGAAADSLRLDDYDYGGCTPSGGGNGFVRAAFFLGCLIKHGLLRRELVRWHVIKPLILYNKYNLNLHPSVRAGAVYQLFTAAGDAILQGFIEAGDVHACFEILDSHAPRWSEIVGFDGAKFNVQYLPAQCLASESKLWSRNFVLSMLRGCSAMRKNKGKRRPEESR